MMMPLGGLLQAAWAVGPGAGAIDKVYACSSSLNGEAVLVFVRALCAVSQEELNPPQPADIPRYHRQPTHSYSSNNSSDNISNIALVVTTVLQLIH